MSAPLITVDRLRELLCYDPDTGAFVWRVSVGGRGAKNGKGKFKPGAPAGTQDGDGYLVIRVDGRLYRAHRLAWLYMTGRFPDGDIDHRMGLRADNRWSELREKTRSENLQNRLVSRSAAGLLGAHFDARSGRFEASIQAGGKRHRLGMFKTAEEAHRIYMEAKLRLHPGFVRERLPFAPEPIGAAK